MKILKNLKKKQDGNFGDILGTFVVMIFAILIMAVTININIVMSKKLFVDRQMRRIQLDLEQNGELSIDIDELKQEFLEKGLTITDFIVNENGLKKSYGDKVSIELKATASGADMGMFPVFTTDAGNQRSKTYEFGGKYVSISKAGPN